jgi:hypothetical protein
MITKKFALSIVTLIVLSGCQQPLWNKPGASVADFNTDKFACMQVSQQQSSSVYVNRYGGVGSSGQTLNQPLYDACMNSKGWTQQSASASSAQATQKNAEVEAAVKDIRGKAERLCTLPQFEPYYSKTACSADKITFEQLADKSKISPEAKAIFTELRNQVDAGARESWDLVRKFDGPIGAKKADLYFTTAKIQNDRNNLDLYNGAITWGEYNRRRQEIWSEYVAASKNIR